MKRNMNKLKILLSIASSITFFMIMFFWDRPIGIQSIKDVGIIKTAVFILLSLIFGFGLVAKFNLKK
jgi:hypothetical protein